MVRVIFRKLSSLVEETVGETVVEEILTAGESDMASGSLRSDRGHESNISLSSQRGSKAGKGKRVKGARSRMSGSKRSEKNRAVSKKTA